MKCPLKNRWTLKLQHYSGLYRWVYRTVTITPRHIQKEYGLCRKKLAHAPVKTIKGGFWGGHISLLPIDRELTFSGFLAGKICENCNNIWMSNIESKAQCFIYLLIEGKPGLGECDEEDHDTLAKWAF
jgi:hypothetical protein